MKQVTPDTASIIPQSIAGKVLTIGLEHRKYEGGIGYVIHIYEKFFSKFKYVTTYKMATGKLAVTLFFLKQYGKLLKKLFVDKSIEIVHIHGAAYGSFYRKFIVFLTAKYLFGRKTIYHVHASEFKKFYAESGPIGKRLIRWMVEETDVLICLSESWKAYFTEHFKVKRIEIVDNVVDSSGQLLAGAGKSVENSPLKVLFLGFIGKRKGIFDLLEVLRQHKNQLEGRLELIVGGNGEVDKLTAYLKQHDLERLVRFEGWVSGNHKQQLLLESDLFILPSYNEGLPISILEAMSYRLPVISTPVGGTPEVVREGVNGFLVQPGDINAMLDRLLRFVEQPELLDRMGAESGRISLRYQPQTVMTRLRQIYETLLSEPQKRLAA